MVDLVKISALDEDTTLGDTDILVVADPGVATKKITGANLKAGFDAAGAAAAAVATHEADTTNVHGITDTSTLYRSGGTDVAVADGGTGSSTAAGAATNLGLGTGDSPQFTAINVGHASDTTITRPSGGDIAVEGKTVYRDGGTDVAVADGGTGASTASGARTNLGLVIATDVEAHDPTLTALAGLATGANKFPYSTGTDAFSQADLTAFARTLLDDADAATMQATLGLGSLATLSAVASAQITDGSIVNADINASAAIAYSKLALASSIVQGDLAAALITALSGFSTPWTVIVKPGDTSRNSTTTPAADPDLTFSATSSAIYEIDLFVIYNSASGAGTPDIKVGFGEDATARGNFSISAISTADATQLQGILDQSNAGGASGTAATARVAIYHGWHRGNGGAWSFYWAQNTSSGSPNDTTVLTGSLLRYRRIL